MWPAAALRGSSRQQASRLRRGAAAVVVASPDHQPEARRCDNRDPLPEAPDTAPGHRIRRLGGPPQSWPARRRQPGGSAPSDGRCPAAALLAGARASEALLGLGGDVFYLNEMDVVAAAVFVT